MRGLCLVLLDQTDGDKVVFIALFWGYLIAKRVDRVRNTWKEANTDIS